MLKVKSYPKSRVDRWRVLTDPQTRLLIWEKARGIWKNRQPDPIKELEKMRQESNRPLPSLK